VNLGILQVEICGSKRCTPACKPCVANRRISGYTLAVRSRLSVLLRVHRPRINAEWRCRLRIAPADTTLLANPDTTVFLMDQTLAQLESLVRSHPASRWLTLRKTHLEPLRSLCSCGLNPLLAYFGTGAEALETVLSTGARLTKDEKFMLYQAWHFLAQGEIEALCEGCSRVCAPALSFPAVEKP
jgi:hypothetical protein